MKMYDKAPNKGQYQHLTKDHGKASDCIACGMCEEHCPQHLPIRAHLQQIAQIME
jgi:predicted aldo/keto reductase-like oxidoreductase